MPLHGIFAAANAVFRHKLTPPLVSQQICHRDLKLENTLLDGSPAPRLKICDFGYSKVRMSRAARFEAGGGGCYTHPNPPSSFCSPPCYTPSPSPRWAPQPTSPQKSSPRRSTTGRQQTCGPVASPSTSCWWTLHPPPTPPHPRPAHPILTYPMLWQVGAYPFEDPDDPRNFRKTIGVNSEVLKSCRGEGGQAGLRLTRVWGCLWSLSAAHLHLLLHHPGHHTALPRVPPPPLLHLYS